MTEKNGDAGVSKTGHLVWGCVCAVLIVGCLVMNGTVTNENRELHVAVSTAKAEAQSAKSLDFQFKQKAVAKAIEDFCK